ncbi:MAG: hypothetical protein H6667_02895 [Ardenticatenaceae bacterium]|nr:hypothetical protein [Ardenticatenaceae bacterium]MCB9442957.1 hypothetical protein [Ardenticatenaceae bacterium]
MSMQKYQPVILFLLILLATGCNSPAPEPLPTSIPVAELPTVTATSLPPTQDLTAVTTPQPTSIPATRPATATSTPVNPFVTITSPGEETDMVLGSDIIIRGLAQLGENSVISVTLNSLNGRILAETQAALQEQIWETGLTIPNQVSGAAFVQAVIQDADGNRLAEYQVPVNLVIDAANADRYLALYHPLRGETAVGGFNLFFDGMVYRPTNSAISISVWTDNCQTRLARQSFALGSSTVAFYWQGFVIVPKESAGPACAIAYFGEEGSEDYREAIIPINILPEDDAQAKGVVIANPPADSHITAGRELLLYGTALNTSEKLVSVSIMMENGRIISQSSAPADFWGYWEFSVTLPPDVFGPAKVSVTANDASAEILINVDPAPTPES